MYAKKKKIKKKLSCSEKIKSDSQKKKKESIFNKWEEH